MYLAVQFDGNYGVWEAMSDEDYTELREVIPTLPSEKPKYGFYDTHFLTQDALPVVAKHKLTFSVSQDENHGVGHMLVKLQNRLDELELRDHQENKALLAMRGAAIQITIPSLGLLAIREVQVLEDACTDHLQRELNEGWHIIAVCPPNNQRRPDYILGRSNEHNE